jgi:hypothetical protein
VKLDLTKWNRRRDKAEDLLLTMLGFVLIGGFIVYIGWSWSTGIYHWATTKKPTPPPTTVFNMQLEKTTPERAAVAVQDDGSSSGNDYTEMADLSVSPDGDDNGDGQYITENDVEVVRVDWPDGGFSTFKNCSLPDQSDPVTCTATNGDNETYDLSLAQ